MSRSREYFVRGIPGRRRREMSPTSLQECSIQTGLYRVVRHSSGATGASAREQASSWRCVARPDPHDERLVRSTRSSHEVDSRIQESSGQWGGGRQDECKHRGIRMMWADGTGHDAFSPQDTDPTECGTLTSSSAALRLDACVMNEDAGRPRNPVLWVVPSSPSIAATASDPLYPAPDGLSEPASVLSRPGARDYWKTPMKTPPLMLREFRTANSEAPIAQAAQACSDGRKQSRRPDKGKNTTDPER